MPQTEQETSLLFSIRELEALERERIASERAAEHSRQRAAEAALQERDAGARREEARHLQQAEDRRRETERELRDEAARHVAIERATIERVRAEIEARSLKELAETRNAHELALTRHRGALARARCRWLAAASLLVTSVVGIVATFLSTELRATERLAEERSTAFARERDAARKTTTELAGANERVQALEAEVSLLRVAPAVPARSSKPPGPAGHRRHEAGIKAPGSKCTGGGDPLDGCLD
ncbi:MAG TPA: hypothetical protein VHU80_23110 [Polyangiaceae bacterium]|nr:hypothetical protein [Polyangiaceae bacterium]